MVSFIAGSLENLVRSFVERFILPEILKKANFTHKLSHLHMTDPNIQMRTYGVGFSIDHDLRQLKREGKITDSHVNTYKKEAKHILSKIPMAFYVARATRI